MAFNLAGAGTGFAGGALSGAALTGFNPIGIAAGGLIGGFLGNKAGAKKKAPGYTPTPYTGARPPSIDSPGQEILRPTQKQDFDITMRRSLGQDVGYDPSWMTSAAALTKSNLDTALSDRLRDQGGMLSASGLSGNPRAYEATKGRSERDYSSDLENSMNRLNVANMEASREDKNAATNRLAALNRFNFGQENTGAQFDLNKWQSENSNLMSAAGLDAGNYWNQQAYDDQNMADIGEFATSSFSPSAKAITAFQPTSGQGIAPTSQGSLSSASSLYANPNVQNLKKKFSF